MKPIEEYRALIEASDLDLAVAQKVANEANAALVAAKVDNGAIRGEYDGSRTLEEDERGENAVVYRGPSLRDAMRAALRMPLLVPNVAREQSIRRLAALKTIRAAWGGLPADVAREVELHVQHGGRCSRERE